MSVATAPHRISAPAKIGYGVGAIGGQIFRDTPALILPIYMITVLGIPAWMAGAILSGLTFMLTFSAPDFASPWASAAYMTLSFALASTAYSLFSVPYLSVAAEMSDYPAGVRACYTERCFYWNGRA